MSNAKRRHRRARRRERGFRKLMTCRYVEGGSASLTVMWKLIRAKIVVMAPVSESAFRHEIARVERIWRKWYRTTVLREAA